MLHRGAHLLVLLFGLSDPASAQSDAARIEAERLDFDAARKQVRAQGDVRFDYQGRRIGGERFFWDQSQNRIEAQGQLRIEEADGTKIRAQKLVSDGKDATSTLEEMDAALPNGARLTARAAILTPQQIELTGAGYTSCPRCAGDNAAPLWRIRAAAIGYDRQRDEVRYRHARLELYGLPIFYLPYLRHVGPNVARRSGLLPARLTHRTQFGAGVRLPYHFALAENYDLTLAPEPTEQQGTLWHAQWRHLLASGAYELEVTSHRPRGTLTDAGADKRAYGVRGKGQFRWGAWDTHIQLEEASNDAFFRRYWGDSDGVNSSRYRMTRRFDNGALSFAAQNFTYAEGVATPSAVAAIAPSLDLQLRYGDLDGSGRLDISQKITHSIRPLGVDISHGETQIGWRKRHRFSNGLVGILHNIAQIDLYAYQREEQDTALPDGAQLFSNLTLAQVSYPLIRRGRHTQFLTPQVQFMYASDNEDYQAVPHRSTPIIDLDRRSLFAPSAPHTQTSRANIGLDYRFAATGGGDYRAFLGQSYNLSDTQSATHTGFTANRSALIAEFTAQGAGFDVSQNLRLSPQGARVLRSDSALAMRFGDSTIQLGYTKFRAGELVDDPLVAREEISGRGAFTLSSRWQFGLETRYDLERDAALLHRVSLDYTHPCAAFRLAATRNLISADSLGAQTNIELSFVLRPPPPR